MRPSSSSLWIRRKMPHRATMAACSVVSFLLLTISLLSPSWLEIIDPETGMSVSLEGKHCNQLVCSQVNSDSNDMTAVGILLILATIAGFIAAISLFVSCLCFSHYKGLSGMLVSSVASFTTGALGFAATALYPVDMYQKKMSSAGDLSFTWRFGLALLVFALYTMNGFLSFIMHLLYFARRIEWQSAETSLEGELPEPAAGDSAAAGLSGFVHQEAAATPAGNLMLSPSICFNKHFV